ncbi:MAG TPA: FAD-binding oxidoreductase [Longimicrobiales bacterium]|nr:FAD-binding oxidoreductase [Longimicrobiales bacterium]
MAELIAPRSAEEAAAVMKQASDKGLRVACSDSVSGEADIVLSSRNLNSIAEYEPADLVIAVGSGATLGQIGSAVAPNNQFLALDPPVADRATVGGITAAASAGPLRFAHGTPRDQVLGLEVVTGDGRILSFGGRVVKNVAGYDVVRLMVGSRGTLGFITRVNLRLKPKPQVDRTIAITSDSFTAVGAASDAIVMMGLEPVALELLSASIAAHITGNEGWVLLARVQGNVEAAAAALEAMQSCAPGTRVTEHETDVWPRLSAIEAGSRVVIRLANLRSLLPDTIATTLRIAQETGCTNARIAAHAGNGIVRLLADEIDYERTALLMSERKQIEQTGGSLIIERAEIPNVEAYGHSDGARLMRGIKKIFDPAGVMGAERFSI